MATRALRIAAAAAALVALAACGRAAEEDTATADGAGDSITTDAIGSGDLQPDSVFERWARAAFLPDGAGLDSLTAAFGRPDSLLSTTARNEYDSTVVDTIRTAVYREGLRAEFFSTRPESEFIMSAVVRSDRYLRDTVLRIGMPWEEVLARIGPTRADFGDPWLYWCGSCSEPGRNVMFEVTGGRVSAITFGYYMG